MAEPPAAAVTTFLFTDIEGSTPLWERYPDAMRLALADHDTLLRQAIESQGGRVFKTVGDAFCAVFASPAAPSRPPWPPNVACATDPRGFSKPQRSWNSACAWACTPGRPSSATATTSAPR